MKTLNKKAFSVIEYAVLLIIIISAFLIMRNYIQRGVFGIWGQTGQSFAFGRQYDSQKTVECSFDDQSNLWYDRNCFQTQSYSCNGNTSCEENVIQNIVKGSACPGSNCGQLNK